MLDRKNSLLLVVDVQGKLAHLMYEKERLFKSISTLIRGTRLLGLPLLVTEQVPEKLGKTVPEIAELIDDAEPIPKKSFSCLGSADFARALQATGRKSVILVGIECHVCVYQTARDLLAHHFHVQVVADAVSSRTVENRKIGLDRMQLAGAHVTSVEMLLFELMRVAEGEKFREIISLVR